MNRLSLAAACTCVVAAGFVSSARATTSPTARACPSLKIVDAAIGKTFKSPTTTKTTYGKACTYAGGGLIPLKVEFQVDTASTFASSEKAARAAGPIIVVSKLGKEAWATKAPGLLDVFDGHETIKILDPLAPTASLEALARKLV